MEATNNQKCPLGHCQITWTSSVSQRAKCTPPSKGPVLFYQVHFSGHTHLSEHYTQESFFHANIPFGILQGMATLSPGTLSKHHTMSHVNL